MHNNLSLPGYQSTIIVWFGVITIVLFVLTLILAIISSIVPLKDSLTNKIHKAGCWSLAMFGIFLVFSNVLGFSLLAIHAVGWKITLLGWVAGISSLVLIYHAVDAMMTQTRLIFWFLLCIISSGSLVFLGKQNQQATQAAAKIEFLEKTIRFEVG